MAVATVCAVVLLAAVFSCVHFIVNAESKRHGIRFGQLLDLKYEGE